MLFNSFTFVLFFLPITLIGFFLIGGRGHHRIANAWLVGASLFFYGWWNPAYLGLIVFSILFNYAIGVALGSPDSRSKLLLGFGVTGNLALLGYFKYANFFIDNVNLLTGVDFHLEKIILPLAISFFTFQQIAYLVDAYRGEAQEYNFLHYCLFVTFFPQLIAGPIVHHKEMLPQFAHDRLYMRNNLNLSIGITIFAIGLLKKVILADGIAVYATPVFDLAESGKVLGFVQAWIGAMAYTLQLYFDFSGYSDMAIGIARMFGVRLPLNFHSPYKAHNITEFWRRWHMTLSRFLRDYLYIPLGGNQRGKIRRYVNLLLTMLLGGLWHGAAWTFVLWGALHGVYLVINHGWHLLRRTLGHERHTMTPWGLAMGRTVTLFAVVVGWVFFRAESLDGALGMLRGMAGYNGLGVLDVPEALLWITVLSVVALWAPNTQEIMGRFKPAFDTYRSEIQSAPLGRLQWWPSAPWALATGAALAISLSGMGDKVSEFLYFQF